MKDFFSLNFPVIKNKFFQKIKKITKLKIFTKKKHLPCFCLIRFFQNEISNEKIYCFLCALAYYETKNIKFHANFVNLSNIQIN